MKMAYKQVLLICQNLKMPKGKLAAQAAHAAVQAVLSAKKDIVQAWLQEGGTKVALKVANEQELKRYLDKARRKGLTTALIKDGAHTFFKEPTITCGAIGPNREEEIDTITKELKLV